MKKLPYHICYKYLLLKTTNKDIIIELSFGNTLGNGSYGAATNTQFVDSEEISGSATGIGQDEESSLKMCLNEIFEYSQMSNENNKNKTQGITSESLFKLEEIDYLPYSISFIIGKKSSTFYFKIKGDKIIVLTDKKKVTLNYDGDLIEILTDFALKNKISHFDNKSKKYLMDNDFYPTFESMIF